jgi:hypothetical protein
MNEGRTAGEALRANEKLEVASGVMANLGTGLLAAGFGRWFLARADGWAVLWIVFGLTAMAVAIQTMSFLNPEVADG